MIALLSLIGITPVIGFLLIGIFNRFVKKKNWTNDIRSTVQITLKKGLALCPGPIGAVKNHTEHKKNIFPTIAKVRNVAIAILLFCLVIPSCIVIQDPAVKPSLPQYDSFKNWLEVPYIERNHSNDSKKERIYTVDFENIILEAPLAAEIMPTQGRSRVEIIAPDKVLKRLIIEKNSQFLSLRFGQGSTFFRPNQIQLRIYVRRLLTLQSRSNIVFPQEMFQPQLHISAQKQIEGSFNVDHIFIETYEDGYFSGIVRAAQLDLAARDRSHIEIYGKAGEVTILAERSAFIDAKGLSVEIARIQASGQTTSMLSVSRQVNASANGNAEVTIFGDLNLLTYLNKTENGRIIIR